MTTRRFRSCRNSYWLALVIAALTSCQDAGGGVGVVSAATPEAAAAGVEILEAGGNAIDAAVAVSFALAVTEPAMSGLGGQTQILMQRPGEDAVVINGTSYSPAATPENATADNVTAHRATTIPATLNTLDFAFRNFGSGAVEWADLVQPAIGFAENGFTVGAFRHLVWLRHREELAANAAVAALFLNEQGAIPDSGATFRQPVLAQTLRRIAAEGAADFYRGEIAGAIARDMAANGGWITAEDLATLPEPSVIPALETTYRGYDVATLPPPGGGWVVLQILNLLEQSTPEDMTIDSPGRVANVIDALRIGHRSRQDNPVRDLVDFEADVQDRISKETARRLWLERGRINAPAEKVSATGETTHFSVVDRSGMVVAVTASINAYFGARAATPELGFLYNSYMHEFELDDPGHPFALRGRAMPYSSMSPTVVSRDGQPVLVVGSPGSSRIISTVAQIIHITIDGWLGIADAVAMPRLHVVPENQLYVESVTLRDSLEEMFAQAGYDVTQPTTDLMLGDLNAYYGGVHALALENGEWVGAADPRRDGAVMHTRGR
jgi:gamma-glutamyltranspeptidase/glutathione hydrolase